MRQVADVAPRVGKCTPSARPAVVVTLSPTKKNGGERGIRTPGPLARSAVFKTTRLGMRIRDRCHQLYPDGKDTASGPGPVVSLVTSNNVWLRATSGQLNVRGTYGDFYRPGSSSHHLLPTLPILQISKHLRLVLTVPSHRGVERLVEEVLPAVDSR